MHPYSSVNLKREDIKTILYDAIELPWGYPCTNPASWRTIQSLIRWAEESTHTYSRGET